MTARALAILGTGSDVGKSLVTAGLCRLLRRAGVRVAPFKAQNMSNNSFVTPDGKEIGRAQALQAQACGLAPDADMNPILLKPESDRCAQVVVQGTVWGAAEARTYFERRTELAERVRESYGRLAHEYEMVVIEGAGSAAEVNLRDRDLANWFAVEMADAQVVLVADIDRGGVFAQVIGTLDLLAPQERARVVGIIINKFRGDAALFEDGVAFIEQRTGLPVLGVVPMLQNLRLDQEDSLDLDEYSGTVFASDRVNIAVVLLPRMSNFTDFNRLADEEDVVLRYVAEPHELQGADVVVLPGTKNTIGDLSYLRDKGFPDALRQHLAEQREVVGICGGYQILGRRIADPGGVEGGGVVEGLGWLDVTTTMMPTKVTHMVYAEALHIPGTPPGLVQGYAVHMGATIRGQDRPCFQIRSSGEVESYRNRLPDLADGAVSPDGLVWGTYIHGVFDQPDFRRLWLNRVRARKGLAGVPLEKSRAVAHRWDAALDRWADHLLAYLPKRHQLPFRLGS